MSGTKTVVKRKMLNVVAEMVLMVILNGKNLAAGPSMTNPGRCPMFKVFNAKRKQVSVL